MPRGARKKPLYSRPSWATYQTIRCSGLYEDVCAHGVGHPNAEWLAAHAERPYLAIHGCDGCCSTKVPADER